MKKQPIAIVGTGRMAREHAKVLKAMRITPIVIGRSREGVAAFEQETGLSADVGGLRGYKGTLPKTVIIAVDADLLPTVAKDAIRRGARRLLLEKPGALSFAELKKMDRVARAHRAQVFIAYNRRFLASALKARELIKKDGGPVSYTFNFTERLTAKESIKKLGISRATEKRWFIANSTHVVDLAFFLGGTPRVISGFAKAGPLWSPHPSLFAGSGVTTQEHPFSYRANWELPGPWSVEVGTKKRRLILEPLETLREEVDGAVKPVQFDGRLDKKFKPGFCRQMESFLGDGRDLPTLAEQIEQFSWYEQIEGGS